nr:chymotrypsin BI-like [Penaeus vannamei]
MCAITVLVFIAICYPAVADVTAWQLNPLPVIEVPTNGTYEFTEGPLLPGQRIVGGHEADPYKYGYQACVTDKANFYCGGSIIKDNIVLTAAHCML